MSVADVSDAGGRTATAAFGARLPALTPGARAELDEWSALLRRLGVSPRRAADLALTAERCGTSLPDELLASGAVDENTLYRQIAMKLGLAFRPQLASRELRIDAGDALELLKSNRSRLLQVIGAGGFVTYVTAPRPGDCPRMRRLIQDAPALAERICIVPPSVVRRALIEIAAPRLAAATRDGLFAAQPRFSARLVVNGWQGTLFGGLVVGLATAFALAPVRALLALHFCATFFFFCCVWIRLAAAFGKVARPRVSAVGLDPATLPVYSILVALRDETDVLPDLLSALGRISWPRARLEVKFVCEDDDRRTIEALRAHGLRPWAEIIEVPRGMPGTKPNALTYALPLTRGEFIAVYDAEDRPHPLQLYEAWSRFQAEDEDLACLQAPLEIDNGAAGILPRMFAFEYAALFHRFLPYLARKGLFLPLGGTSNHFRRSALEEVGAWDPYNVTEDADLGVRLARHGYRTGVIFSPTGEEAPEQPIVWLKQRTRWLKGWAQTWLVHMRDPAELASDIGLRSFAAVQILLAGLLVSSLLHPMLLVTGIFLAARAIATGGLTPMQLFFFAMDAFNLVLGYGAFLLLGWRASRRSSRRGFWKVVLFTPLYWIMMSAAAWRALFQLFTRPHHWEKTPHARRRLRGGEARAGRATVRGTPGRRR
ncbi:glycosyltransferase family 2 protein [Mesorhizobium australicum]|uniref:glycosyltransferase family 2 protein n=1 Tax=Mesorhizobium australicum TaxID=536018 RepID=UPI00159430C2|nr:glycosyltransferase [Mesorhizobium australicum]